MKHFFNIIKNIDCSKISFFSIIFFITFLFGFYIGIYKKFPYNFIIYVKNSFSQVYSERRVLAKIEPDLHLLGARYAGTGVTINNNSLVQNDLILLSGFFENSNELRLIRRNGAIVARWPVKFSEIFPDTSHLKKIPTTDWNIEIHGALILPNGSVVFDFEDGGLVKLDRCGNLVWTVAQITHHSVERAEGGGYWAIGRRYYSADEKSPFPPYKPPFKADIILKISEEGKVLHKILVPEIFYKNSLETILTSNSEILFRNSPDPDSEITHLNDVQELKSDIADSFPLFSAKDLLLSFRGRNLLMVINPETLIVKWWKIGPWARQHDPEFKSNGNIIVFNNNYYVGSGFAPNMKKSNDSAVRGLGPSNIIEVNPISNTTRVIFSGEEGRELFSGLGSKVDATRYGGLFITEYVGGRVIETDFNGKVIWEYINRYNSEKIAKLTEARVYRKKYFNVSNWSCNG